MEDRFTSKRHNIFSLLVLLIWAQTILMQYIRAVFMRIPIIGQYPDLIIGMVYAAVIIFSLQYFEISMGDIFLVLSIIAVFMLERLFYLDGQEYLDKYLMTFVVKVLPLYFVGVGLGEAEDKEKIIYRMYVISMITLFASIIYRFAFGASMSDAVSKYVGDMDHAYKLLPHCCLIAYYAVKRTNILNIVCVAVGGLYLLMLGTRGAALIYLVLIALLLIMGRTSKGVVARIVVIVGAIGGLIVSRWFDTAILWMYQKAQQFGLSVRIFDKLMEDEFAVSGGRDTIRESLLFSIKENPLFGNGLCSDRVLAGNYAHNIALELWVEFGVIIGTAILIALIIVLFRGYKAAKEEGEKGLILVLIFSSFFKLFLSGSYLDDNFLFLALGLCVCSIRQAKQEQMLLAQDMP